MKTLIIDDEMPAIGILKKFIAKVPFLQLELATNNALEGLTFLSENRVDLLFLDIEMPDLSGLELLKRLEYRPIVILTTAYPEYALEGYDLDVTDYLLKPIRFERFLKAANRAQKQYNNLDTASIRIKSEYKTVTISIADILFVEGLKDYVKIHTQEKAILTRLNVKNTLNLLPEKQFIRIHRSYVVSLSKIDGIQKGHLLIGDKKLPIGQTYKETVQAFFNSI